MRPQLFKVPKEPHHSFSVKQELVPGKTQPQSKRPDPFAVCLEAICVRFSRNVGGSADIGKREFAFRADDPVAPELIIVPERAAGNYAVRALFD